MKGVRLLIMSTILTLFLLQLVSSEIVITGGGSTNVCIISSPSINSCFINSVQSNSNGSSSGIPPTTVTNQQICIYARSFIEGRYTQNILFLNDTDITSFNENISRDLHANIPLDSLKDILSSCPSILNLSSKTFSIAGLNLSKAGLYLIITLVIFVMFIIIFALVSNRRRNVLSFLTKEKNNH